MYILYSKIKQRLVGKKKQSECQKIIIKSDLKMQLFLDAFVEILDKQFRYLIDFNLMHFTVCQKLTT